MARRTRSVIRRPTRREMVWLPVTSGTSPDSVGANNGVLLAASLNVAAKALRPFTIVRTRGRLMAASDQLAASEAPHGILGCIVVSESASAAGIGSIPTPGTEGDADFFVLSRSL